MQISFKITKKYIIMQKKKFDQTYCVPVWVSSEF